MGMVNPNREGILYWGVIVPTHGNYKGLATLLQIDQATLYADNELTNTQLTVYLLAEQN